LRFLYWLAVIRVDIAFHSLKYMRQTQQ